MAARFNADLAIVFDLGGVLIDWNPRHLYRKLFPNDDTAMEKFLAEICTQEWNVKQDAGRSFNEAVQELIDRYPSQQDLIMAYHLRWEEMVTGAIDASVEILRELKDAGYRLSALSNWSAEKFVSMPARFSFLRWFETIVISGEVKAAKPDERIYAALLARINRSASQCLFIDDSPANVDAARQLGFHAICFQSPAQLRAQLVSMELLSITRSEEEKNG